jgi:broad specificity phosphatase PhoE
LPARALAPLHPDLIVSSPLLRAVATAQAIAFACGLNVRIDEAFIDRDHGDWAGYTLNEVEAQFQTIDNAPGVELHTAAGIRARKALELVADQAKAVGVVVAHDAINRLLINAVELKHFAKIEEISQPTGSLNQLQRSGSTWSMMRVGIHASGPVGAWLARCPEPLMSDLDGIEDPARNSLRSPTAIDVSWSAPTGSSVMRWNMNQTTRHSGKCIPSGDAHSRRNRGVEMTRMGIRIATSRNRRAGYSRCIVTTPVDRTRLEIRYLRPVGTRDCQGIGEDDR